MYGFSLTSNFSEITVYMQSQGDSSQLRFVQMLHYLTALHNAYTSFPG